MLDRHPAKTRRQFTQAARDAALAKRRELAALPKDPAGSLQVFVVRGVQDNAFCWEIRRFGAIVVARSASGFSDGQMARDAGEDTLRRSFRLDHDAFRSNPI